MSVQTQLTALAARLGNQVAEAHKLHKDKPVDTGNRRLPGGIKNGVMKLGTLSLGTFKDDKNGKGTKGEMFFSARGTVVFSGNINTPAEHRGMRVLNLPTTLHSSHRKTMPFIPLCNMPDKGKSKGFTFADSFFDFQNFFKMLKFPPCQETDTMKILLYYQGIIDNINQSKTPIYITFSTNEWTPPLSQEDIQAGKKQEDQEPMLFETWHERTEWAGVPTPPGGVNVVGSNGAVAHAPSAGGPPQMGPDGLPNLPPGQSEQAKSSQTLEERVAALVKEAPESEEAGKALCQLAWDMGWSEQVTDAATEWAEVGKLALAGPASSSQEESQDGVPTVGSHWNYFQRDGSGNVLKDAKNEPFPSIEVEVTSTNEADKTCVVKNVKDGKVVLNKRTRKPADVKWEWLE